MHEMKVFHNVLSDLSITMTSRTCKFRWLSVYSILDG